MRTFVVYATRSYGDQYEITVNDYIFMLRHIRYSSSSEDLYVYHFSMDNDSCTLPPQVLNLEKDIYVRYLDTLYIAPECPNIRYTRAIFNSIALKYESIISKCINSSVYSAIFKYITRRLLHPVCVLDFGCGLGLAAKVLEDCTSAHSFLRLFGCDISQNMLKQISLHNRSQYEAIILTNGDNSPFDAGSYDYIVAVFVAHLVTEQVIDELFRILRPAGEIIFNEYKGELYHRIYDRFMRHPSVDRIQVQVFQPEINVTQQTIKLIHLTRK